MDTVWLYCMSTRYTVSYNRLPQCTALGTIGPMATRLHSRRQETGMRRDDARVPTYTWDRAGLESYCPSSKHAGVLRLGIGVRSRRIEWLQSQSEWLQDAAKIWAVWGELERHKIDVGVEGGVEGTWDTRRRVRLVGIGVRCRGGKMPKSFPVEHLKVQRPLGGSVERAARVYSNGIAIPGGEAITRLRDGQAVRRTRQPRQRGAKKCDAVHRGTRSQPDKATRHTQTQGGKGCGERARTVHTVQVRGLCSECAPVWI